MVVLLVQHWIYSTTLLHCSLKSFAQLEDICMHVCACAHNFCELVRLIGFSQSDMNLLKNILSLQFVTLFVDSGDGDGVLGVNCLK